MALRLSLVTTVALLSSLASSAGATVTFREDFEAGTLGKFAGKSNPAGRVTVVMKGAEVVSQGNYAVKVTMMGDERFNAQQLRVQLKSINVNVVEGGDTYLSVYMYVKDAPKTRDNFYYFEGSGSGNVMTWWLEPSPDGGTVMKYGTGNLGARGLHWTGNFEVGKWHQMAAHMHWGKTDATGNIRLWFDGVMVLDKKVQTMVNPGGYYSEPGIHRDMSRTGASEAGVDSLYFDNFVTADKLEEIELMAPGPGASDAGVATPDAGTTVDASVSDTATRPPGSGGSPGSGGGSGAGGVMNSGGRTGSGGTGVGGSDSPGSGGTASGSGGISGGNTQSGGSSGGNAPSTGSKPSGGCSLSSSSSNALGPTAAILPLLLGLLGLRKRRSRR